MKKFLNYILPRYWWFMLYYREWFRNVNGIKGFSEQYLAHLLEETLSKSNQLKKEDERLKDRKQRLETEKSKRQLLKTIPLDELDPARRKLRKEWMYLILIMLGESFLTYIIMQVFIGRTENLIDGSMKFGLAFIVTAIVIVIVEEFIRLFMALFVHKEQKDKGHMPSFVLFAILTIIVEYMIYNFAQVRAKDFEGDVSGMEAAGMGLTILSMILPFAGGYLAYEWRKYFGPYRNTTRLDKIEKELSKIEQQLKANKEEEEHYFLLRCSDRYAVIDEFKIYKTNYNATHNMQDESLEGHFAKTRESFFLKAREEYLKRVHEPVSNTVFEMKALPPSSSNGVTDAVIIPNA